MKNAIIQPRTIQLLCWAFTILSLLLLIQPSSAQESAIGQVSLVKGVVTADSQTHGLRILDKGSQVYVHDEIETAENSFVVVAMSDQGKLTLRPDSKLLVQVYNAKVGQEQERLKLLKGGLRAVSGLIGKARPEQVKLETRTTTIGIRGTDFIAIDCRPNETVFDCMLEEQALKNESHLSLLRKRKQQTKPPVKETKEGVYHREVERQPADIIRNAVYFSVYDGIIYAITGNEKIELAAGDTCFREVDNKNTHDQFGCLAEPPRFMQHDKHLGIERDEFTLFDIFSDVEAGEEGSMCTVAW